VTHPPAEQVVMRRTRHRVVHGQSLPYRPVRWWAMLRGCPGRMERT
jgi:hypothetical protein